MKKNYIKSNTHNKLNYFIAIQLKSIDCMNHFQYYLATFYIHMYIKSFSCHEIIFFLLDMLTYITCDK